MFWDYISLISELLELKDQWVAMLAFWLAVPISVS